MLGKFRVIIKVDILESKLFRKLVKKMFWIEFKRGQVEQV